MFRDPNREKLMLVTLQVLQAEAMMPLSNVKPKQPLSIVFLYERNCKHFQNFHRKNNNSCTQYEHRVNRLIISFPLDKCKT